MGRVLPLGYARRKPGWGEANDARNAIKAGIKTHNLIYSMASQDQARQIVLAVGLCPRGLDFRQSSSISPDGEFAFRRRTDGLEFPAEACLAPAAWIFRYSDGLGE
jgi:hypothetical protein